MKALKCWQYDLLGSHFKVYTDHWTLKVFWTPHDLSWQQVHWQEFLSPHDFEIVYIKGKQNMVTNTLSCLNHDKLNSVIAPVLLMTLDMKLLYDIKHNYETDNWCKRLRGNIESVLEAAEVDGLLYWKGQLVIPRLGVRDT